jgi:hypothetical protein
VRSKGGIPTRRASHFHGGLRAYRTLQVDFGRAHAGLGLGAAIEERERNHFGSIEWLIRELMMTISSGSAYLMRSTLKVWMIHVVI